MFTAIPRSVLIRCLLACAAAGLIGCGDDSPTSPTNTTPAISSETYTGAIAAGGSGFYSFTVTVAGTANVTFGSLTNASSGRPIDVAMQLAFGIPAGEGCNTTSSATVAPGLSAQLSSAVTTGIYCVQFSDVGNLTVPASFGIRIVHP